MRKRKYANSRRFNIFVLVFALIIATAGISSYDKRNGINKNFNEETYIEKIKVIDNLILKSEKEKTVVPIEKEIVQPIEFKITAYDLSIQSTGKTKHHPAYGISRSGLDLKGKSWDIARVVSVDPNLIPLGSKIHIEFKDEKYKIYNGEYNTEDTGGNIKGNHIDLFLGDFNSRKPSKETLEFGITYADVTILE